MYEMQDTSIGKAFFLWHSVAMLPHFIFDIGLKQSWCIKENYVTNVGHH